MLDVEHLWLSELSIAHMFSVKIMTRLAPIVHIWQLWDASKVYM